MKNDPIIDERDEWSGWQRLSEIDDINYINFMSSCLSLVRDKHILEFGSGLGWHTKIMLKFEPKKIICVEPDKERAEEEVYKNNNIVTLYSSTANDYYSQNNDSVDMVVCCGLLYHLHSPIHLLEKIINVSKPNHILIETIDGSDIQFIDEEFHSLGNAHSDKNVKFPILKLMTVPADIIIECIETTNYRVEKIHRCKGIWNNNQSPSIVSTILFKNIDSH